MAEQNKKFINEDGLNPLSGKESFRLDDESVESEADAVES